LRITTSSPVYAGAYYAKGLAINKNLITNTQKKNPKGKKSLISILYTANNRISHHHRQTSAQKKRTNEIKVRIKLNRNQNQYIHAIGAGTKKRHCLKKWSDGGGAGGTPDQIR
jgi:hypothetical protein